MKLTPVNFLVEKHGYGEDISHLIQAIEDRGMSVSCPKYIPFEGGEYNQFPDDACVTFFGSLNLARQLVRTKPWIPGPYCKLENFKCSIYYAHWGKYLWNQNYIMLPYGDFRRNPQRIASLLYHSRNLRDWTIFIRPDDGFKTFTGQTIGSADYEKELAYLDSQISPENLIIAAPNDCPHTEWRFFCDQRRILTGSQYKVNGQLFFSERREIPGYVQSYAQKVLDEVKWFPERLFVMDICSSAHDIDAAGLPCLGVVELNSFSCSGLYKCDPFPIVDAAIEASLAEYKDINEISRKE